MLSVLVAAVVSHIIVGDAAAAAIADEPTMTAFTAAAATLAPSTASATTTV